MRHKYTIKAKSALHKSQRHNLDDDDWDQRPEWICKGCGFHKNVCTCPKNRIVINLQTVVEPSIDFYA